MNQFGKLTNSQLITPTAILIGEDWTTNPNETQFIEAGYKEIVRPDYPSYQFSERYEETETLILVHYDEIVIPQTPWHEDTNFQIKFTADDLLDLLEEVPAMVEYTKTLTTYRDMMFRYFYVNYFNDMEKELLERYGGVITERGAE